MDGNEQNAGGGNVKTREDYMDQLDALVAKIEDPERRAVATSMLEEVGKDLGMQVATDEVVKEAIRTPDQDRGLERDFEHER